MIGVKVNTREIKFYDFISLNGGSQHGRLRQGGGLHISPLSQQDVSPCTLSTRTPTIAARITTNFKNILSIVSIINQAW
jgi:hypothetical protein